MAAAYSRPHPNPLPAGEGNGFRGGLLPAFINYTLQETVNVPKIILDIASAVGEAGGRALLVGGCVRDELMGKEPKDWDLEVYGIDPLQLRHLLDQYGKVNVVGEAFTVYKIGPNTDVSLPRRE